MRTATRAIIAIVAMLIGLAGGAAARAGEPPSTQPTTMVAPARTSALDREPIQRNAASGAAMPPTPATQSAAQAQSASAGAFNPQRVVLALGLIIGLIIALRFAMKKMFPATAAGRASGAVRVLARVPLSPKQQVLLIQVGRRVIVVGDSGSSMNALAQIDDPDEAAALLGQIEGERAAAATKPFGLLFGRARDQFDPRAAAAAAPSHRSDDDEDDEPRDVDAAPADLGLASAQGELRGLMDKVRGLAQQLKQ